MATRRKVRKRSFVFNGYAAPYRLKAGKIIFYSKMLHLTYYCIAHRFCLLAEALRLQILLVDSLITTVKKVFLKSPIGTRRRIQT